MNPLEKELIEKFRRLSADSQWRVLATLRDDTAAKPMSVAAWLEEAKAARVTLRPDSSGRTPTASELVNEVREERDADILRSVGFGSSAGDRPIRF